MVRIATYNIRNGRAIDLSSCWWRRRRHLARVIRGIDVDVWAMQEAYRFQLRYLQREALPGWSMVSIGRDADGGGEACPIFVRPGWTIASARVRWFGRAPDEPGTRLPGAGFPRIVTLATITGAGAPLHLANTHLDERSPDRRRASLEQLVGWLDRPALVVGDLNAEPGSTDLSPLVDAGMRPALAPDDGPTSNGFGDAAHQKQIDHVFVDEPWTVACATVRRDAGLASDHWPVVAELTSS